MRVRHDAGVTLTVRRLEQADARAARRLGWEAFGVPPAGSLDDATVEQPGRRWFGAFEGDELIATAVDREYDTWFGGRTLPTAGIASVTVRAEHRGRAVLGPLMAEVLTEAMARGAVLSTLLPSAPRIYRRFGFESITTIGHVLVPSAALHAAAPTDLVVRRATAADAETIRRTYDTWAARRNGPLTRRGVSFPTTDEDLVGGFTGVSLAVGTAGEVRGYLSWTRGSGGDVEHAFDVADLIALDGDAYRALLRTAGSFASMVPQVRLRTTGSDPVRSFLPGLDWAGVAEDLYMLAVLDVPGAMTGSACTPALTTRLSFALAGGVLPELDGGYVMEADAGRLTCDRAPVTDSRTLDPRGLALLYAGSAPCGVLRSLGLLRGGDPADDLTWDALFAGRPPAVLNTF